MGPKVRIGNNHIRLPKSQIARIAIGILLIIGGFLGFLPVLGFWMIPLGLLVLSIDLPFVRRWRRKLTVWWHRRKTGGVRPQKAQPAVSQAQNKETTSKPSPPPQN